MNSISFKEETSSKLPAMTLLSSLGYTFIPPSECEALRGNTLANEKKSTHQVILLPVMRAFLAKQTFSFAGKQHTLSEARSEEHTSELQSRPHLVCRLLLEKENHKAYRSE